MGAEIDRLEIEVEAQAKDANTELDKLVGKLNRVSASLSDVNSRGLATMGAGVNKLANAMNNFANNTKTTDFSRLSRNLEALGKIDTSSFSKVAGGITQLTTAVNSIGTISDKALQVTELTKSISKLGSASVQKAITNLPALANALNDLFATLSKAPTVSSNVIQMTNALAKLASQGSKVGTAGNGLTNSLNRVGSSASANTKKVNNFASAIGKLYQRYFLFIRVAKKLWSSIKDSMNYVETLNYFDAAYGQVAEKANVQWEDMGKTAAEKYYNSFAERAKELTSKMTGFSVNDDGTLIATGQASLGINPSKLMNYQAMFAQMSSSMGIASETSLKLSQALTEIGGDLASVKNLDFDKVWTDMASGLAGMSRTLDKYGVNIRNVNLQQKLMELGIDANITALNQNDKALLRAIILLDSTKYAWGDLADTINQPANQIRLLESNWANLSRTIGNLFLPVVQKVLPYVNGLVIAVQRLFTWLGSLLGLNLSKITNTVGSSDFDFNDLIGGTDDLTDSLNNASKATDKLKRGIRAFDELNVISTKDDSGSAGATSGGGLSSGLLDAAFDKVFEEYQAAWDEAFARMENRANEFADKVEKFLQPVKDIFEDFAVGDFFKVGQDTSKLVSGIFNFFADAIDKVDWYGIGHKIGEFLDGIEWTKVFRSVGNFVETAIYSAIKLWEGSFDADPIATGIVSALAVAHFVGLDKVLKDAIIASVKNITFTEAIALALPLTLFVKVQTVEGANDYLNSIYKFNSFKCTFTDLL